jgi:multiple sugar transport system permease protein
MRRLNKPVLYLSVIVVCVLIIFPIYWMFTTSLAPVSQLRAFPPRFFPVDPQWSVYQFLFAERPMARWLFNSTKVALLSTAISLTVSVLAGYSLSRFRVWGTRSVGIFILTSRMLPSTLLIIPLFVMMRQLGLLGSHWSLVLAHVTFIIPFATWMLKGYFDSLPRELEEAAMMDGCNPLSALTRVILPISAPGIAATTLYGFILSWSDFLFARTFLANASEAWTVPVGIATFKGEYIIDWNVIMAGALVGTIPIVIIYLFLERFLVGGLSAGAIK